MRHKMLVSIGSLVVLGAGAWGWRAWRSKGDLAPLTKPSLRPTTVDTQLLAPSEDLEWPDLVGTEARVRYAEMSAERDRKTSDMLVHLAMSLDRSAGELAEVDARRKTVSDRTRVLREHSRIFARRSAKWQAFVQESSK